MATLFKRPDPKPGQKTYHIDIPGATDLFHFIIPALNDPKLKRERIIRMKTKASPVPESLRWIPDVINKIDDAQDLLSTALVLAKPLIRRLPSRFLPFVGWGLAISDIADLSTQTLSLAMTPGLTKPDLHKKMKDIKFGKKEATERVKEFLKPGGWRRKIGDALQAAQAADTLTGVGLTLGSIMGFASDLIWAPYRLLKGDRVEIRLPPEGDLLTKAYRFLTQTPKQFWARDIFSPEDHALILAAHNVAVGVVLESGIPNNEDRINEAMSYRLPIYIPWEPSSREALEEEGFDLDRENYYRPYFPSPNPTISDTIDGCLNSILDYNLALRRELGVDEVGSIFWLVGKEAGFDSIFHSTGIHIDELLGYTKEQYTALRLAETNLALTPPYTKDDLESLLYLAISIAEEQGKRYPSTKDWKKAAGILGLKFHDKE